MKFRLVGLWACVALNLSAGLGLAQESRSAEYRSPYKVVFTFPMAELVGDLERGERGDRRIEADVPHAQWYSEHTLRRWGAWGPGPRAYPPLNLEGWSAQRKRERVVATALRFEGYGYQHHHIPDWDPPAHWPWKKTGVGHNGKGVDCSNLTGFVYNLAFGLHINTDVTRQSEERLARVNERREEVRIRRVELPESYEDRIKALRTGDLLYIRNNAGHISHVVIWVGAIGQSPDGVPLVLDSHGADVKDSDGNLIPCGVHLRPFRKSSWYNHSASHASRLIEDEP